MARFDAVEGSYSGTSDDVVGRWYIVDTTGDSMDKRGRGYASREEAIGSLVDRLSMWPEPTDLVGRSELAQRAGVALGTTDSWRRRHADFPAPIVELSTGPVWDWREVAAWVSRPRPAGRPRNA